MTDATDSPLKKPDATDSAGLLSPRELVRLKRASILHLVDLKTHAYSPRFTELKIDPRTDRIVALPDHRPTPLLRRTP